MHRTPFRVVTVCVHVNAGLFDGGMMVGGKDMRLILEKAVNEAAQVLLAINLPVRTIISRRGNSKTTGQILEGNWRLSSARPAISLARKALARLDQSNTSAGPRSVTASKVIWYRWTGSEMSQYLLCHISIPLPGWTDLILPASIIHHDGQHDTSRREIHINIQSLLRPVRRSKKESCGPRELKRHPRCGFPLKIFYIRTL